MSMMPSAPIPGTTPTNFIPAASTGIDQAKAAALAQLAQSGKTAQGYTGMAGAADAAAKTQAIKTAMALAAGANAPTATGQDMASRVGQVVDPRSQQIAQIGQNYKDAASANQGAYNNYFALTKAGLPVAQAALGRTIAADQLKAANTSQRDALSMALAQLRLQTAQGKAGSSAGLIAGLGGQANAGQALINQADTNLGTEVGQSKANIAKGAGTGPSGQGGGNYDNIGDTPTQVGANVGLPPAVAQALADNAGYKTTTQQQQLAARDRSASKPPTSTAVENDPGFPSALQHAHDILTGNVKGTPANDEVAAVNKLVKEGMPPGTAYIVVSRAASILRGAANLPAPTGTP